MTLNQKTLKRLINEVSAIACYDSGNHIVKTKVENMSDNRIMVSVDDDRQMSFDLLESNLTETEADVLMKGLHIWYHSNLDQDEFVELVLGALTVRS